MAIRIVGAAAIAATTTPAALSGSGLGCDEVLVQCYSDSLDSLLVGTAAAQVIEVMPGKEFVFAVNDVSALSARSKATTATGGWLASRTA